MADVAETAVEMVDFPGLITNVDPREIEPGAAEVQVNATCVRVGELQVRMGIRQVTFEGE